MKDGRCGPLKILLARLIFSLFGRPERNFSSAQYAKKKGESSSRAKLMMLLFLSSGLKKFSEASKLSSTP